jgi:FixJ family two-component response regulator/N-acetylglutamate synthase-like GNAT family acetyltransferase
LKNAHTVYIIDPDTSISDALSVLLATYGIVVQAFKDAESFIASDKVAKLNEGCLLVDATLPGLSCLSLVREVKKQKSSPPIIILANAASTQFRKQALSIGVADVLEKPLMNEFLLARISTLIPIGTNLPKATANSIKLLGGSQVTFRAMRPEDADIEQAFVRNLSARSKHLRFFSVINELLPDMLERFTHHEYPISYALIATIMEGKSERQIGVARYMPTASEDVAEFAVVVADDWQGQGIATYLLQGLTTIAAIAGIKRLEGMVLRENDAMLKLARELGFTTSRCVEDFTVLNVVKTLNVNIDLQDAGQ